MGSVVPSHVAAVVLAAGSGTRFGGEKHTQQINGVPFWQHCVEIFHEAGVSKVVVVGDVPGGIPGGVRRRDSVAAGLSAISSDWVLIHDAARPLVTPALVRRVLDLIATTDADGVIPGVPLTDTIKLVDGSTVVHTVDRSSLVAVQTPQAFRTEALRAAHAADDVDATDDAALIERAGGTVDVVEGDPNNIKVTYREDLARLRAILEGRNA